MVKKIIYIIFIITTDYLAEAQTYADGLISGTNLWTEEQSPYIIDNDMTIQREAVLIIEAGTEIVIADDKLISVKGSLICEGIPGKPVKFKAKSKYWGGIYIDRTAQDVSIKFTEFNSGGRSSYTQSSVFLINEADVFVEYSKFLNSYLYGITSFRDGYADMGGGSLNSRGFNTFSGFSHNRWAIVNRSKIDLDAANNCWNDEPSNVIYDNSKNDAAGVVNYEPVSNNCEPQKPDKAELIFPPDSTKDIPVFFNLKWHKLNDISYYRLQFGNEMQFDNPLHDKNITDSIYTVNGLKYGERYFWRVRGVNFAGKGDWSETFTFVTYDTAKPAKVNLTAPTDNALSKCEVLLEWEELQKTDEYNLLITNDETIIDTTISDNFISLNEFANNDEIKWKVRGKNRNGYGKWSEERTFSIMDNFFAFDKLIYNKDNLITKINSENSTELVFSDSSQTTIYNITENKSITLDFPVDYYTKSFLNHNNQYDEIYSTKANLNIIFDEGDKHTETTASAIINKIITADINNNGKNEIICKTVNDNTAFIEIFELQGEYPVIYGQSIALSSESEFFVMDIDIDGDKDIIVLDNNMIQSYINDEGDFHLSDNIVHLSDAHKPFFYDINNDGFTDILLNDVHGISLISNNNGIFQKDSIILNSDYKLQNVTDLNFSGFACLLVSDNENSLFEYNTKNNSTKNLNIISGNTEIINYNDDFKPDLLIESQIYTNNICSEKPLVDKPDNLRYSFISDNSIMLEWDRSKLNSNNNYNITYEISFRNNQKNKIYNLKTKNNFYIIREPEDADYDWQVRAVYNEFLFSEYTEYQGLYTKNALPKPPESWTYTNKTGLNTTILLRDKNRIEIEELNAELGDALGIFFIRDTSLICGGYSYFSSQKVILTAWGDNQQTTEIKDGFGYTEEFRFKYWDASEKREIPVNVEFEKGIGWFKPDTLSEIKSISPPDTANIIIEKNKWNYISSGIIPFNPFFSKIETLQSKKISDIESNIYDIHKDELKHWNTGKGYKIYSETNDTITIFGSRIHPEYHPFKINKNQWYLLPAILNDTTQAVTALKNIYDKIILLKDEDGKIISPVHNIEQFEYLIPNKSYEILLSEDSEFVIHSQESDYEGNKTTDKNLVENNSIIQNSGNNATLMAVFDNHLPGEIAVYADNEIVGAALVDSDTVIIPIKGRDISGYINGAKEGEALNIIYSVYDGNSFEIPANNIYNEINKQYESILRYSQNSFHSIQIEIDKILSINNKSSINVHISPIPADNFIFVNSSKIINSVEILDLSGTVRLCQNIPDYGYVFDISKLPNGIYFVRVKVDNIIDDNKIILEKK